MHTGHYISGGAHGILIVWALVGGMFRSDPPDVEVAEVSVFSEAEFAALTRPQAAPQAVDTPDALPQPEIAEPAPVPPEAEAQPETPPEPVAPEVAEPDPAPAPVLPTPEPQIADQVPEPPAPEPEVDAPEIALRPIPRPAPRVAPEAVPEPEPDAEVAPEVQETVEQAETPDTTETEEQTATAPEAAATEIVTEAEEPARAPTASMRPQGRPNRPAPAPAPVETAEAPENPAPAETPAPAAEPAPDDTAAAIAGALEEALSGSPTGSADGPPLTQGETEGFRVAVQECWVVDVGSQAANVTVTVGFDMDRSGRVESSTLRMLSASGGTGDAAETAFQAARRAILRCQGDGYDLPPEKFDQWKRVEMTFNPESMRIR